MFLEAFSRFFLVLIGYSFSIHCIFVVILEHCSDNYVLRYIFDISSYYLFFSSFMMSNVFSTIALLPFCSSTSFEPFRKQRRHSSIFLSVHIYKFYAFYPYQEWFCFCKPLCFTVLSELRNPKGTSWSFVSNESFLQEQKRSCVVKFLSANFPPT